MNRTNLARTLREPGELVAHGLARAADLADLEKVAARYAIAVTPAIAALIDREIERSHRAPVRPERRRTRRATVRARRPDRR